ncbi:MAG: alpha/beta hydrolase [Dehalococcoidia bacterium]|nr:alpha/beta hydrolase [Dehalococcoidia bacterium]
MIQHEYAQVNGVKLHYAFDGQGKLIMFLHGFPEYWEMWKAQLNEFAKDHLAVAPDMRGYNLSSAPQDVKLYRQKVLAEDIRQLAEHLGQKKIILVAHDWGGGVAWSFAILFPEYLERLIIINSPHPATFERELRNNPSQRKASSYMLFFRSPQAEATLSENNYSSLLNLAFGELIKSGVLNEDDIKGYISAWSKPGALTGGLNYYRATNVEALENLEEALKKPFMGDLIPKITIPTLVIWGEKDTALLAGCLDGMEKYVPGVVVKRIPDASHWVVREKPDLVNRYIREFIGK